MHGQRPLWSPLLALALIFLSATSLAAQSPSQPTLRTDLLARAAVDQAVRGILMQELRDGRQPDSTTVTRLHNTDGHNTSWLKQVVVKYGWPGISMVEVDGANAAFLLLQHADHDTAFQTAMLPLLERGVSKREVSGQDYALLFDRIAVNANRPQRFGTQAKLVNGLMIIDPIEDSVHVDERRGILGLSSLAEYVRLLDSIYVGKHPN
jgi:hypothetical protein